MAFIEKSGGVLEARGFAKHPAIVATVQELKLTALGSGTTPKRQAPRYPISVIMAVEAIVTDHSQPAYVRMAAWFQLVQVWGALRFDDHRG
ncbi:MAG: hypothetical protein NXI07_13225 [bacterium]|nr:hypothetical protein [bacterium]